MSVRVCECVSAPGVGAGGSALACLPLLVGRLGGWGLAVALEPCGPGALGPSSPSPSGQQDFSRKGSVLL